VVKGFLSEVVMIVYVLKERGETTGTWTQALAMPHTKAVKKNKPVGFIRFDKRGPMEL